MLSMLRIGLTGGIGSGKSTVARVFETLGIPVYYADDAAKKLMNEDPGLRAQIIRAFGDEAYTDGRLNRAWLGAKVFGDPEKVQQLNALVHPATIADAAYWLSSQHTPYAIKEAALIFESGSEKDLDYVIGVSAPEETRVRRVMERDGTDENSIRQRMQNQMNEAEKMKRCNFIILNDGNRMVIPQVLNLHHQLIALAAARAPHA
jgi:dephospho-CoA kinase